MTELEILDLIIRTASCTVLAMLAALFARSVEAGLTKTSLLLMLGSSIAIMLLVGPTAIPTATPIGLVLRLLASMNTYLLWLFIITLFDDPPGFNRMHGLAGIGWLVLQSPILLLASQPGAEPPGELWFILIDLGAAGLLAHAAWRSVVGFREDLVDSRRRLRGLLLLVLLIVILIIVFAEGREDTHGTVLWISLFRGMTSLMLGLFALFWLCELKTDALLPVRHLSAPAPTLTARQQILLERLETAMREQRCWLAPDLNLPTLARILETREHSLRRLINKQLGFKNFADFLNTYRIEEVKRRLAQADDAHLPITTIALEAGYGSLAPFNRAFKAREGMPPSQWREQMLRR